LVAGKFPGYQRGEKSREKSKDESSGRKTKKGRIQAEKRGKIRVLPRKPVRAGACISEESH
jgi:hypothetical protein